MYLSNKYNPYKGDLFDLKYKRRNLNVAKLFRKIRQYNIRKYRRATKALLKREEDFSRIVGIPWIT
jgi:hypothetical protein